MAVRTSMTELITQLRLLADDASGAAAQFTDQQLQDVLDQNVTLAMYEQLNPLMSITTGGVAEYKAFAAPHTYWESDATVNDASYTALTPASSDFKVGYFTFNTTQALPLLIYGRWYDMNAAAADAWDLKAASYAAKFDFNVDGGSYQQSQQYQQAIAIAKQYRAKSVTRNGTTFLRRADVIS